MKLKLSLLLSFIFLSQLSFSQQVKVALLGDYGAAALGPSFEINEAAVADLVKSWDVANNPLDAILTVGDNNYQDGLQMDIETNIGQFYGKYIEGHPDFPGGNNRFFPAIGNHDYGTSDCNLPGDPSPHLNYFNLPGNELYYDHVIGNVHFFILDSDCHQPDGNSIFSQQADWLEAAMTNSNAPWKIVYFHHAPYTSGPSDEGTGTLRWDFKDWGATAVIGGHYHYYERLEIDGLPYFVNGSGGNSLHTLNPPIEGSQLLYNEKHGAMQMTFSTTEANFKFINVDDQTIDDYTITIDNDCENQGGDSDGDGVCDNQDCQPNNPNFPTLAGTSCDDENENTENDIIQPDGCTCEGTPIIQNGNCNDIDGFTKLGEFNHHGYFLAEDNAAGWENAQSQCLALDGYLVSIENQVEKDFIDPFISGVGNNRVVYIGLSKNQNDDFVWTSDGSVFNENNYDASPWEGGSISSSGSFTTLRKWNPTANVNWGAEGGNAYRRFILEKTCSTNDCGNQGGDSDGDGVCDNQDCQPNNPNSPTVPGTNCDDENENTENDIIQPDGCTCEGTPIIQNGNCNDIDGFTKLGEFNNHGYFLAENNAAGWGNAQSQCLALDGYLVSIENQAEKDFIDPFISGVGNNRVVYIGLSKNQNDDFIWTSDGSIFNENNYDASPWEGGSIPSSGNFTTLRKWNPTANVNWGAEGGNAYRRFILEKTCSTNDCENQGGDSDGDGVCDNQDCQPNNPNFPATPGASCDDENENTENDVIQSDGCTCEGTPILSNTPCDEVTIIPSSNSLTIENINVPIAIVKIYDSNWSLIFVCNNNCPSTITETNLSSGIYHIEYHFFDATWGNICSEIIDITLPGNLINLDSGNFFLNNTFTKKENEIIIYPNPASDILSVKYTPNNNSPLSIQILDSTGKVIIKTPIYFNDESILEIPIHDLHTGLFFLILENKNGIVEVNRFIKKD
ncbi:MAG: lectin-like protein [Saprospiraceae bacterium]